MGKTQISTATKVMIWQAPSIAEPCPRGSTLPQPHHGSGQPPSKNINKLSFLTWPMPSTTPATPPILRERSVFNNRIIPCAPIDFLECLIYSYGSEVEVCGYKQMDIYEQNVTVKQLVPSPQYWNAEFIFYTYLRSGHRSIETSLVHVKISQSGTDVRASFREGNSREIQWGGWVSSGT